jgi:hypothetical protein
VNAVTTTTVAAPALSAGRVPSSLHFYQEDTTPPDDMGDSIARIVMARFRQARDAKANYTPFQGKSVIRLLDEADRAMEKRFTDAQAALLSESFGFCPTRYYGLAASKTLEIANWKTELVAADPGSLLTIQPTPAPRLPEASVAAVKQAVKDELFARMEAAGLGDPQQLLSVRNGRLHPLVKRFLEEKGIQLRRLEQARLVSEATAAAAEIQTKLRDVVVEGDFREAYSLFSLNQVKYGVTFIRFPYWQRRVVLSDKQDYKGKLTRKWATVPTFAAVSPWNMFPVNDGGTLGQCTAVMEYREINKVTLVTLAQDARYDRRAIESILDDYSMRSRTWLFPEAADTEGAAGQQGTYWAPEELVAVLHHEGLVTGRDLQEHGLTGYEATQVYEVRAEVCCGRTIRLDVKDPLRELPRSYASAKFDVHGDGVWNASGVPAILHDTEERLQVLLHLWENNVDWAMRPPLQTNPESLKNPADSMRIRPGGQYEISDMIGPGVSPDPIRAIRGPTAQYQILFPLITAIIRQADHEVGVPSLSDMNTLGRGTLGELSARVSQAVRRVRTAAYGEDRSFRPMWEVLYQYVLEKHPELVENADLDFDYIGVLGLLQKENARQGKQAVLALARGARDDGAAGQEVVDFAYNDILKDFGVPTQALGMSDPVIDNAMAVALRTGAPTAGTGLDMVPKIDGRSGNIGNIPTAVSPPNGAGSMPPGGV